MRAMPRTWPSMRLRRLRQDDFVSDCMLVIYPRWVYTASLSDTPLWYGDRREAAMTAQDHHEHPDAGGASCCNANGRAAGAPAPAQAGKAAMPVKDPVCGMDVDPHAARHRAEHGGRTYYFCSAGCRTKFEADPGRFLA